MREVTSQDATREFSDLIARVRLNGERVLVTRFGKPAAMIVPVEDVLPAGQSGTAKRSDEDRT